MQHKHRATRSFDDVPSVLLQSIIAFARSGRAIAGSNRFAAVCRAWRAAAPIDADNEQLQLYLDQKAVSESQLYNAFLWMATYDKQLVGLELPTTGRQFVQAMVCHPPFGSRLQSLSIQGSNTLLGLLRTNMELPHLQQLRACISDEYGWQVQVDDWDAADSGLAPVDVSRLAYMCPRLTEMHLELSDGQGGVPQEAMHGDLEGLLSNLLPSTLQRLCLHWNGKYDYQNLVAHEALSHLTALQQLELSWFFISDTAALLALPPQCSIQLVQCLSPFYMAPIPEYWVPLKHRLTALHLDHIEGDCIMLGELTRLTSLGLDLDHRYDPEVEPGPGLSNLTALLQLQLRGSEAEVVQDIHVVLQHVSGISGLRRLALDIGNIGLPGVLEAAGALTQLTLLCLSSIEAQQDPPLDDAGGPLQALQHLVGLRQLQLSAPTLLNHPSGWLSALTQLTLLAVITGRWPPPEQQLAAAEEQQEAADESEQCTDGPQQSSDGSEQFEYGSGPSTDEGQVSSDWGEWSTGESHHSIDESEQYTAESDLSMEGAGQATDESEQSTDESEQYTDESVQSSHSGEQSYGDEEEKQQQRQRRQQRREAEVARCVAAVVPRVQHSRPASLQQLALLIERVPVCDVVPSPLPGVSVHVREQRLDMWVRGHQGHRPMQPCPHLSGVWEVL
jgi:hypothetical protein